MARPPTLTIPPRCDLEPDVTPPAPTTCDAPPIFRTSSRKRLADSSDDEGEDGIHEEDLLFNRSWECNEIAPTPIQAAAEPMEIPRAPICCQSFRSVKRPRNIPSVDVEEDDGRKGSLASLLDNIRLATDRECNVNRNAAAPSGLEPAAMLEAEPSSPILDPESSDDFPVISEASSLNGSSFDGGALSGDASEVLRHRTPPLAVASDGVIREGSRPVFMDKSMRSLSWSAGQVERALQAAHRHGLPGGPRSGDGKRRRSVCRVTSGSTTFADVPGVSRRTKQQRGRTGINGTHANSHSMGALDLSTGSRESRSANSTRQDEETHRVVVVPRAATPLGTSSHSIHGSSEPLADWPPWAGDASSAWKVSPSDAAMIDPGSCVREAMRLQLRKRLSSNRSMSPLVIPGSERELFNTEGPPTPRLELGMSSLGMGTLSGNHIGILANDDSGDVHIMAGEDFGSGGNAAFAHTL